MIITADNIGWICYPFTLYNGDMFIIMVTDGIVPQKMRG